MQTRPSGLRALLPIAWPGPNWFGSGVTARNKPPRHKEGPTVQRTRRSAEDGSQETRSNEATSHTHPRGGALWMAELVRERRSCTEQANSQGRRNESASDHGCTGKPIRRGYGCFAPLPMKQLEGRPPKKGAPPSGAHTQADANSVRASCDVVEHDGSRVCGQLSRCFTKARGESVKPHGARHEATTHSHARWHTPTHEGGDVTSKVCTRQTT